MMLNLKKYNFTDEDDEWSFQEYLESIVGFKQSNYKIKGYLDFEIEMEAYDNANFKKPQVFQQNALNFFMDNQELVLKKLSESIMTYLYKDTENQRDKNTFDSLTFVKQNVSIESLNILGAQKANYSYVVFIFGTDDEHGLGIIIHKDRIIDIADADTALFDWNHKILQDKLTKEEWKRYKEEEEEKRISENIARSIRESEESQKRGWKEKEMNIKWWQFWKK